MMIDDFATLIIKMNDVSVELSKVSLEFERFLN